jgi:hypothetical protein
MPGVGSANGAPYAGLQDGIDLIFLETPNYHVGLS